ncbi:tol-pal system protein YbgF [Desulfonatronovibrio hydrogenovorans]|uniref:tol-pal system protein YbgF n=1 Tax=Desulfonatronovibrio hydrogenovorans TaxID=53245 RepID=UPI00068A851C|nr:tol-pal system protein YbgF [Desulfonatronovibrio hydrogenovorans]
MLNPKLLIIFAFCFLLASCVTTQSDVDTLRFQVRSLERQQQNDRQVFRQTLEEQKAQLEAIEQGLTEAGGSVQATQANLWAEVQSLKVQVATLTGRLDSLERDTLDRAETREDNRQAIEDMRAKTRELDRSVQMISSQLGLEMPEQETRPETVDEFEPIQPGDSARALYQRALDSFYDRNYELAQSLWEEFADNFPDHPLTSNAHFWQGESFYQLERYAQAVLAYQEVITNFSDSNKMSASMLKQGMSFFHLGREEAGRLVLNELLQKYPDTAEARRAKAFMSDR